MTADETPTVRTGRLIQALVNGMVRDADTLGRVYVAIEPHMQAQDWQCPCCQAVAAALDGGAE